MKKIVLGMLGAVLLAQPVLADGKVYVQLPDLSDYHGKAAEDFLYQVVLANIVSSNCSDYQATEEEWSLLTDSADILWHDNLGLTTDQYIATYETPAFAALDDPNTCDTMGPKVQPILDELVAHGGSLEPLPDQERAYEDWRKMQDAWDAQEAGTAAPSGKTKTK